MNHTIYDLRVQDELFGKFCTLNQELKDHDNNMNKLEQLKEDWGLVLTDIIKKIKPQYPRDLKDKVLSLGLIMISGAQKLDSLYEMLSFRVSGEYTPSDIQNAVVACLLDMGTITAESISLSDDIVIEIFARLAGLNIILITEKSYKAFRVSDAEEIIMLGYTSPIVRSIDGQDYEIAPGKYHSILKHKDVTGYPAELIELFNAAKELTKIDSGDVSKAFAASKNPDTAKEIAKVNFALEQMQRDDADRHKANIKEIAEKTFDKFATEAKAEFMDGYKIFKNPAHIIKEAFARSSGASYSTPLSLIERAIAEDTNFNAAAYYNKAYFLLRQHGGNYKQDANTALRLCVKNIHEVLIPQLEIIYLCEDGKSGSDLSKQVRGKIKLLKDIIRSSERLMNQIQNSQEKELDVSNVKPLKDGVSGDELGEEDLHEFIHFGFRNVFELEERLPESSFFGSVLTAFVGVVQIVAGACCMIAMNPVTAIGLFKAGIGDLMDSSYKIATGQMAFNIADYITAKGKDLLCQLAISCALSVAASGKGLIDGVKAWGDSFVKSTKEAWGAGMQVIGMQTAEAVATSTSAAMMQGAGTAATITPSGDIIASSVTTQTVSTLSSDFIGHSAEEIVKSFTKELVKEVVGSGLKYAISSGVEVFQKKFAEDAARSLREKIDQFFGRSNLEDRTLRILVADKLYVKKQVHQSLLSKTLDLASRENHLISSAVSNILQFVAAGCSYDNTTTTIIKGAATLGATVSLPMQALSQIAHFVDEVGAGFLRSCANLPEYSLREMISHSLKGKNKAVSEPQLEMIMSTLQIKGYLTDDSEIDVEALKRMVAEANAAGMSIYSTKILEGEIAGYNFEVASVLDDLRNNYEKAVYQSSRELEDLKSQLARHGQQIIYAKVRNEIISPLTNKAVVQASEHITNGIQSTLAQYSKGGLLTDAIVGAAERAEAEKEKAKEAKAKEAGETSGKMGVSSGSDDGPQTDIGKELEKEVKNDKSEEVELSGDEVDNLKQAAKEFGNQLESGAKMDEALKSISMRFGKKTAIAIGKYALKGVPIIGWASNVKDIYDALEYLDNHPTVKKMAKWADASNRGNPMLADDYKALDILSSGKKASGSEENKSTVEDALHRTEADLLNASLMSKSVPLPSKIKAPVEVAKKVVTKVLMKVGKKEVIELTHSKVPTKTPTPTPSKVPHGEEKVNVPGKVDIAGSSKPSIQHFTKSESDCLKLLEEYGLRNDARNSMIVEGWDALPSHLEQLKAKLPQAADMQMKYPDADKTQGIKIKFEGGHHEITMKRARVETEYASQEVDYISIRSSGQVLGKDGNFIIEIRDKEGLYRAPPKKTNPLAPDETKAVKMDPVKDVDKAMKHPDAHIPLSEWKKWKDWYKPE